MEEEQTLARRIREAREALGISQKQLGILAGVDEFVASARINQYERDKHEPDHAMAVKLAAVLKVPPSYLYEPDDKLAELIRVAGQLSAAALQRLIQESAKLK